MSVSPAPEPSAEPAASALESAPVEPRPVTAVRQCPNCGRPAPEAYCGGCGQRQGELRPTLGELLRDFSRYLFRVDSRFVRTLRTLFIPGQLTVEYLQGRRESYERPFRLFLVINVIYFLLSSLVPGSMEQYLSEGMRAGLALTGRPAAGQPLTEEQLHRLRRLPPRMQRLIQQGPEEYSREYNRFMMEHGAKVITLSVPVFAAMLMLLYRRRDVRYAEHFVFVLHTQAFSSLIGIPSIFYFSSLILGLWLTVSSLYLLLAMRRVYPEGWGRLLLRWLAALVLQQMAQLSLSIPLFVYITLSE